MLTKIQLLTTIECYEHINYVFGKIGMTENSMATVEKAYHQLKPMADNVRDTLISDHGSYDEFISGNSNHIEVLQSLLSAENHSDFNEYFKRIGWYQEEGHILVPLTMCTEKLDAFDLFVGYAVDEAEFDFEHMAEHEGISEENAKTIMSNHNEWLRDNSEIFDLFIDGSTKEEAVELIKNL